MNAMRRGACPGVTMPMRTGDGLLARMLPEGPLAIEHFVTLCRASHAHGNGIMEVTQRGSLQVRGLSEGSAVQFADVVRSIGLGDRPGPAVLTPPLMGFEPHSIDLDSVMRLRKAIAAEPTLAKLSPKTSIVMDGDERLHLDQVFADIRVRAHGSTAVYLSIAGTAATASPLGYVPTQDIEQSVLAILSCIARLGETARARDLVADEVKAGLFAASPTAMRFGPAPAARPVVMGIGVHPLIDGSNALGIALPFGFSEAGLLNHLAETAHASGAHSIRPAPGRTLLLLGLPSSAIQDVSALAAGIGFVTQVSDARRHIIACAGAPACASALLDTRTLATQIATAAAAYLDGSFDIHLSGCAKGCAHPKPAALTLVGPNHLVVDGRATDTPNETLPTSKLASALVKACAAHQSKPVLA